MYKSFHGRFLKFQHKFWEVSFHWASQDSWTTYFSADITANRRTDHAGFRFSIEVMRFSFEFEIYDQRHWDYDAGKWDRYERTETELDDWL